MIGTDSISLQVYIITVHTAKDTDLTNLMETDMTLQLAQTAIVEQRTPAMPLATVAVGSYAAMDNKEMQRLQTQALIQDLITFRTCLQMENRQQGVIKGDVTSLAQEWIPHLCVTAIGLLRQGGVAVEEALFQQGFIYTTLKNDARKIHITTNQFIELDSTTN